LTILLKSQRKLYDLNNILKVRLFSSQIWKLALFFTFFPRKITLKSIMYLVPDLVEDILLGLPLKSILKFKTVSKQWKSILESRMFAERRMNVQKKLKIMAARDRNRFRPLFEGDEEVDMLYLNCNVASRPSLSCDGLVCIPIPGWINVLNPSTGEFLRFSSGRDPRLINDFECVGNLNLYCFFLILVKIVWWFWKKIEILQILSLMFSLDFGRWDSVGTTLMGAIK